MKLRVLQQASGAWTLIELLVVIAVIVLLSLTLFPANNHALRKRAAQRGYCVNNLKQIGLAYRLWAQDHGGNYPMDVSTNLGGTLELAGTDEAWRTYQVMSNELSTPRILFCPADAEHEDWATNFSTDLKGRISYFIGLDVGVGTSCPRAFFTGDDNFAIAGQPVKSGLINLFSNSPVAWTTARHYSSGNIGLADGSVQGVINSELVARLSQTGLVTNRLVIP